MYLNGIEKIIYNKYEKKKNKKEYKNFMYYKNIYNNNEIINSK